MTAGLGTRLLHSVAHTGNGITSPHEGLSLPRHFGNMLS
jgi:hypothetical protein